jgi:hypothetical protein
MPLTCPECGTKDLPDTARFCHNCGKPQVVTPIAEKFIVKKFLEEIENDNLEIVQKMLLEDGQLINGRDLTVERFGAMHYAVRNKGEEKRHMVDLLILFSADINIASAKTSLTPLHLAVEQYARLRRHLDENIRYLETWDYQAGLDLSNELYELVSTLLSYGANPNAKTINGDTPLHFAVRENSKELVHRLYEAEADLTLLNNQGNTPLALAESILAETDIALSDEEVRKKFGGLSKEWKRREMVKGIRTLLEKNEKRRRYG